MFSINSEVDMDEVDAAHGVASPFLKERGRVRLGLGLRQVALNSFAKWHSSDPRPLTLVLSPSVKGEATDYTRFAAHCGHCNQPEISNGKVGRDT
jgi:hypothetical protein